MHRMRSDLVICVNRRLGWLVHRMRSNLILYRTTESPGFEPGLLVLETRVLPIKLRP